MDDKIDEPYSSFEPNRECWIVVGRGGLAFRYGPYTPKEAGVIMNESVERGIAITLIMNCGPVFDWALANDLGVKIAKPRIRAIKVWFYTMWQRICLVRA